MRQLWLLLLLCLVGKVQAQVTLQVVTEQWPPYNYLDAQGNVIGVHTEIVRQLLSQADIPYTVQLFPWARSYDLAKTKPNVLIYTIFRNQEREKLFHWFCPLYEAVPVYFVKLSERTDIKLTSIDDARHYRNGVIRDDNAHQLLKQSGFIDGDNLDLSADVETSLRKLIAGRVDMILQDKQSLAHHLPQFERSLADVQFLIPLNELSYQTSCLAVSKGTDPEILARLGKAFAEFREKRNAAALAAH